MSSRKSLNASLKSDENDENSCKINDANTCQPPKIVLSKASLSSNNSSSYNYCNIKPLCGVNSNLSFNSSNTSLASFTSSTTSLSKKCITSSDIKILINEEQLNYFLKKAIEIYKRNVLNIANR